MAKKDIPVTFLWISILWVLLVFLVTNAEAASKNFYFPEVRIEVNIHQDGDFTVDEYRIYDFQGSFSWNRGKRKRDEGYAGEDWNWHDKD